MARFCSVQPGWQELLPEPAGTSNLLSPSPSLYRDGAPCPKADTVVGPILRLRPQSPSPVLPSRLRVAVPFGWLGSAQAPGGAGAGGEGVRPVGARFPHLLGAPLSTRERFAEHRFLRLFLRGLPLAWTCLETPSRGDVSVVERRANNTQPSTQAMHSQQSLGRA